MPTVRVNSNLKLTVSALKGWDEALLKRAARGLGRGLLFTAGQVQTKFLQGPRPQKLGEVTTSLRRSISHKVFIERDRLLGVVGTNIPYARFHELGFKGVQHVKAHRRITKLKASGEEMTYTRRLVTGLFKTIKRYEVRDLRGKVVGYKRALAPIVRKTALARGMQITDVQVKAHDRRINYEGRPFLRPGLADTLPIILEQITKEAAAPS